jgi:hypothetical protein
VTLAEKSKVNENENEMTFHKTLERDGSNFIFLNFAPLLPRF